MIGILWTVALNFQLLDQKRNDLPRKYGECLLANLDEGAILLATGDDAIATTRWLQRVKEYRTDVVVVEASLLQSAIAG